MKSRLVWLAIGAVLAAIVISFLLPQRRPTPKRPAGRSGVTAELVPPPLPLVAAPAPTVPATRLPTPTPQQPRTLALPLEVPIQDHTTLDFSYGNPPMVRGFGKDKDDLEKALKTMDEATKDYSFGPKPEKK